MASATPVFGHYPGNIHSRNTAEEIIDHPNRIQSRDTVLQDAAADDEAIRILTSLDSGPLEVEVSSDSASESEIDLDEITGDALDSDDELDYNYRFLDLDRPAGCGLVDNHRRAQEHQEYAGYPPLSAASSHAWHLRSLACEKHSKWKKKCPTNCPQRKEHARVAQTRRKLWTKDEIRRLLRIDPTMATKEAEGDEMWERIAEELHRSVSSTKKKYMRLTNKWSRKPCKTISSQQSTASVPEVVMSISRPTLGIKNTAGCTSPSKVQSNRVHYSICVQSKTERRATVVCEKHRRWKKRCPSDCKDKQEVVDKESTQSLTVNKKRKLRHKTVRVVGRPAVSCKQHQLEHQKCPEDCPRRRLLDQPEDQSNSSDDPTYLSPPLSPCSPPHLPSRQQTSSLSTPTQSNTPIQNNYSINVSDDMSYSIAKSDTNSNPSSLPHIENITLPPLSLPPMIRLDESCRLISTNNNSGVFSFQSSHVYNSTGTSAHCFSFPAPFSSTSTNTRLWPASGRYFHQFSSNINPPSSHIPNSPTIHISFTSTASISSPSAPSISKRTQMNPWFYNQPLPKSSFQHPSPSNYKRAKPSGRHSDSLNVHRDAVPQKRLKLESHS